VDNFGKYRVGPVRLFGPQMVDNLAVERSVGMAEAPQQAGTRRTTRRLEPHPEFASVNRLR
jgi:hypothetical protein